MSSKDQMLKLHLLEIEIAKEIKRICEKNNIKYFLTAGSVLGAVRHGGFIPWDDDMDIGMLRKDYKRFLVACKTDLDDRFFLQTWDTDPEYPYSYAKLRLKGTRFVEKFTKDSRMHNGLFVDIFPYDNVPDSKILQKVQDLKYFMCKRILWIKKGIGMSMLQESKKQAFKYHLFLIFSKFFNYRRTKEYFRKVQTKYNNHVTQKIVTDGAYSYAKDSILSRWAEQLEPVKFETEEFLTYKDRIEYLTYLYGDYLKLPPVEERSGHLSVCIDFGPY